MFPWQSIISVQKESELPVYLQVSNGIIKGVKSGIIRPGVKIPGSRELSQLLNLHRKTIVKAYDELDAQGWIHSLPSKGTFINDQLPEVTPKKFKPGNNEYIFPEKTGYAVKSLTYINVSTKPRRDINGFHDGADVRLVPIEELTRAYRSVISRKSSLHQLSYVNTEGSQHLREVLSRELNTTHGMNTTPDNIFITRGSQMAIYMAVKLLVEKGDKVIVGDTNYFYTDSTCIDAGAVLIRIPVDENGIDVDQVEEVCKREKIRMVNITPHHHYPTTVTLSASRRMKLLSLAEQYGFAIIEDDYDYDFHYNSNPILPLASADKKGMVIYVGTFSKTIAPAIRIGYAVAPKNLIAEMGKMRQIIDAQGDPFMEQAIAEMYELGEIRRHLKKAVKEYNLRRDFMCGLLKEKLSDVINFKIPEGGLSIWAQFDKKVPLTELADKMLKQGVVISKGIIHNVSGKKLNCTRMGFGWMNMEEAEHAVTILNNVIRNGQQEFQINKKSTIRI